MFDIYIARSWFKVLKVRAHILEEKQSEEEFPSLIHAYTSLIYILVKFIEILY